MSEEIKSLKDISNQFIEELSYAIETNIAEEDEDNSEISPLKIPFIQNTTPRKLIGLLQKFAEYFQALTNSIESESRSAMIHSVRSISDTATQLHNDANQALSIVPDGKAKIKFQESLSKLKNSCLQLKIVVSVRASSGEGDNIVEANKKIVTQCEAIVGSYAIIAHSDRVFTDLDFKQSGSATSGGSWNTINWN